MRVNKGWVGQPVWRFNVGDTVSVHGRGVGQIVVQRSGRTYWVRFSGQRDLVTLAEEVLESRPECRPNEEGRRWCRPPVGVHKPYRRKRSENSS